MRKVFFLLFMVMAHVLQAQTWEEELIKTFRVFHPNASEQAYLAGIEQLDAAVKNYPKQWQAAYYAALYRVNYLKRLDFNTKMSRERYLHQADELLAPWLNEKGHAEVFILSAYIQVLRKDWFTESGGNKLSNRMQASLDMARQKALDNPRLKLVEGISSFINYNEDESSRKDRAREFLLDAEEGFKRGFTESYPLMPSWGWEICQEYLSILR